MIVSISDSQYNNALPYVGAVPCFIIYYYAIVILLSVVMLNFMILCVIMLNAVIECSGAFQPGLILVGKTRSIPAEWSTRMICTGTPHCPT